MATKKKGRTDRYHVVRIPADMWDRITRLREDLIAKGSPEMPNSAVLQKCLDIGIHKYGTIIRAEKEKG